MKTRIVRTARLGMIALVLVGTLVYVQRVPWTPAIGTMRHASLALLALALCFHFMALTGKAGIWWVFLRPLGGPPFTTVARGTLMGATLNILFVGSSGEAGRVLLMSRLTGIPSASVLATVMLERAVDLCGFLTLLACAALLFPIPRMPGIGVWVVLSIAVIALAHWACSTRARRRIAAPSASHALVRRCQRYARHVFASTREIATTRRVAVAVTLTLVDWCSELASYSLIAHAAHFPIGVRGSLLALLAVNVGFVVRVTPGNVGVFELVYASVAHSLGLPTDIAFGVALMLHLVQDVPTAMLGLVFGGRFFAPRSLAAARKGRPSDALQRPTTLPSSAASYLEPARGTLP